MKRLISKLLTIVMMASIIMNTIYVSANAKEVVTVKVEEKPQYKRIYDFNKQGKEVDNNSKEVKNEIIETEVPAKEVVDSDFNALAQVEDSTSYSNENIVLNTPSELRTIETSDSIVLIWNSVESGKGYELEIDGEIKDCGNKTLFVHSNIKDSNIHKYRVRAKNGELKSEWSSYVEKSKKLEIIAVPENIINVPTENTVKISWDMINSASGYDIEVDGVIKDIGKSTNYIHEALEPNTKHTYKVRAKKGDNYGQWSKVITVSTLAKKETTNKDTENKSDKKVVNEKDEKSVVKELKESNTSEVVTQSATQTISSTSMKMLAAATATTEVQVSNTLGVEDVILTLPLNIAVESTNNTLLVHWDKVEGAKSYDIEVDGTIITESIDTFYEHINLLPGTQHTYRVRAKDDTQVSEWSEVITGTTFAEDIIVKSNMTLTGDKIFANLNLTSGTLNLNGFKLTVVGDLVQSGGTINIAGGSLIIGNNITQTGGTMNVNKGKLTVKSNYKITDNSYLSMPDAACYALVEGDFEISSNYDGYNYLRAGTLEVKGNLTQKSIASTGSYAKNNFRQNVGFILKISGGIGQTIDIMDDTSSPFNILDISENPKATFIKPIRAKEIRGLDKLGSEDVLEIVGTWNKLNSDLIVTGSIKLVSGTINLNGHNLTILGNLTQTDTSIYLTGGKLTVGKEYKITGNSRLDMADVVCYVLVEGDFEISSNYNGYNYFKAGTLEIKGNLTQKSLENTGTDSKSNFRQEAGFVVKLSGEMGQTVDILDDVSSYFNILDISENPKTIFIKPIRAREIRGLDRLGSEDVLEIVGTWNKLNSDLIVTGNIKLVGGTINLNGHKLTILGDLIQTDTSIYLTGGKLTVGKDYKITGNSRLDMDDLVCYVLVEGNFEISSNYNGQYIFEAGMLEVKGNLTQKSLKNTGDDSKYNFRQDVGFVVKLSGGIGQTVNIADDLYCYFNILDISENSKAIFIKSIRAKEIKGLDKLAIEDVLEIVGTWNPLNSDLIITGSIKLVGGTINLNGHNLTILGGLTQTGGTINLTGGELIVGKNYNITGDSNLTMNAITCYLLVKGNFEISSKNYGLNNFKIGTLEIKGNLTQKSFENTGDYAKSNFDQAPSFSVKLSGVKEQIVNIMDYSDSIISLLDMSDSYGVIFVNNLSVRGIIGWDKVRNTVLTLENSYLNIFSNETLNCSLNQIGGSINLNGNTFTILGNLNQDGSDIKLNGGQLIVEKDYTLINNSHLSMINSKDYVLVKGTFQTTSNYSEKGYLTEGLLEIKGNVYAIGSSNFYQNGNFIVNLTGDNVQTVMVTGEERSPFNILDISKSGGVIFLSGIKVNKISGLNRLRDEHTLKIVNSNITLEKGEYAIGNIELVGGTLDLNGYTFSVSGNLTQSNETIIINGGILSISKNYTIDGSSILNMTNMNDYVYVKGDFETSSSSSEANYLTAGIFCLVGDFKQGGNSSSFAASGDHTVIFDGYRVQCIYFTDNTLSDFEELIVNNPYGIVYTKDVKVTLFTILGNFFLGLGDGATDAAADLLDMITNPGKIVDGVNFLLQCLIPGGEGGDILDLIANTVKETLFKFGDSNGNVRARMAGKFVGEVVVGLVADKGALTALQYLKGTFLLKVNSALEKGGTLSNVKGYIDDVAVAAAEIVIKIRQAIKTSAEALNNSILNVYSRINGQVDLEFAGYGRLTLDETEILENAGDIGSNNYNKFIERKLAEGVGNAVKRNLVDDMDEIADDIININKQYSDGYEMNNSIKNILNSASYYEDSYEQIAAVTRGITDHAFANGNKRTAFDTLNMLSKDLGVDIALTDEQKWTLIYDIAEGRVNDVSEIAKILKG